MRLSDAFNYHSQTHLDRNSIISVCINMVSELIRGNQVYTTTASLLLSRYYQVDAILSEMGTVPE